VRGKTEKKRASRDRKKNQVPLVLAHYYLQKRKGGEKGSPLLLARQIAVVLFGKRCGEGFPIDGGGGKEEE